MNLKICVFISDCFKEVYGIPNILILLVVGSYNVL